MYLCGYPQIDEEEHQPFLSSQSRDHSPSTSSSLYDKKFLNVEGMTCGACSAMIQKLLSGLDGVQSSSVSLLLKRAEVVFNPTQTNLDDIIEEIEDCGFKASQLHLSTSNKNSLSIQLFYASSEHTRQQILDEIMTIAGVQSVALSHDPDAPPSSSNKKHTVLDTADSTHLPLVDLSQISLEPPTFYGTESVHKPPNATMYLSITYDPKVTGIRSISEWINGQSAFQCKILFDASDISHRKLNIQVITALSLHSKFLRHSTSKIHCLHKIHSKAAIARFRNGRRCSNIRCSLPCPPSSPR